MTIFHKFPKALQHLYRLPTLEADAIPVYRGTFKHAGVRYRGIITIELEPTPRMQARSVRPLLADSPPAFLASGGNAVPAGWVEPDTLVIPTRTVPPAARTLRLPRHANEPGIVTSTFTHLGPVDVGDSKDLDSMTFFVLNGWYSDDGLSTCHEGTERRGRVEVTLGAWQLRIEPRGDIGVNKVRNHQRSTGNSTVTHVGRIRRDNGDQFNAADALKVLNIIEDLLGFALGRVTAAILPVGYRATEPVWARWQSDRAVDRPLGTAAFLDAECSSAQMTKLFEAGYAASHNTLRWQVFKSMLGYHYLAERNATMNMKVLLPVSALQLISYAHLVEELPITDPDHHTNKEWRALDTMGQIRKLLVRVGANLAVPPHLKNLLNVQATLELEDAPKKFDALDCVVRLRNEVAHPKQKQANRWTAFEWGETGFVSTELLHLAILWWLGYEDKYMPRTAEYRAHGDSVYVPWRTP